ncbi:MAG: PIN domain-containing protein [Rhodoluna sp.]
MKYLIDTDIASYFIRGVPAVTKRLIAEYPNWVISAISYHELLQGMVLAKNTSIEPAIAAFLEEVKVAPFDSADALESGRLSAILKKAGTPIGTLDTLIAGHALSLKLTLVTNNVKHFSRVPELRIANWTANK